MTRTTPLAATVVVLATLLTGCGGASGGASGGPAESSAEVVVSAAGPSTRPAAGCVERGLAGTQRCPATGFGSRPPGWLGTRELPRTSSGYGEVQATPPALRRRRWTLPDTVAMLPGKGFAAKVVSPAPAGVVRRSTWEPGCPVAASDLAWLRLTFWGFDAQRHTGELLVHRTVADDIVSVFRTLYRERFPQEQVVIVRSYDPDAPPTGDGNGTGSFVCRPATGATYFSQHAYGLAIDLNTFQNPYQKADVVLPELASAYLRRDAVRPGMVVSGGPVIGAFARIGWEWGGYWNSAKDYQHFSQNGR
ncbi:MAG: hypothetical protein AVDCRST_MAG60-1781 [uncultured Nocardioides sp.]|uniref:Peptidase M15C domain-containing protein n=1 Tax=uncultured Nocardioides sp. TaxID=198441 RepID=A0A6J4NXC9_9ACTN|nr:MAG: hypothetical protein AVDCRST_MAG60-1781 [uncultured Nocardioides sp.]